MFGVIGNPIAHSLSPLIHNTLFTHFCIPEYYEKFLLLDCKDFPSLLSKLKGANITLPYKEKVIEYCDEVIGIAKEIGAVNTLYYQNHQWVGYNTDAQGFYLSLNISKITNALILGAGGSAKAVLKALQNNGVKVSMYNRTPSKIASFANVMPYNREESYELVINATSSGLEGKLPLQERELEEILIKSHLAFDLIYPSSNAIISKEDFLRFLQKREDTLFSSFAKKYKIRAIDGLDMLCYQAFLAFEIFCESQYSFEEIKQVFYP
ncbi:shikimate dehydrogenase [Helicobacter cholecystus]|uniref:shikimate dehydrogenase n=1 Tax=Helicobacter cholecystus TaxID=45498 RepID=UPI002739C710|nr:shikimate dehydrogenase [Helicobacter cholecystus]